MPRSTITLLAACALALSSLHAQAQAADPLDPLLEGGALEQLAADALTAIDIDALLTGFERAAEAAAQGRPVDPTELDQLGRDWDRQWSESGPRLARGAAGLLGPILRELRAELGRELGPPQRD